MRSDAQFFSRRTLGMVTTTNGAEHCRMCPFRTPDGETATTTTTQAPTKRGRQKENKCSTRKHECNKRQTMARHGNQKANTKGNQTQEQTQGKANTAYMETEQKKRKMKRCQQKTITKKIEGESRGNKNNVQNTITKKNIPCPK